MIGLVVTSWTGTGLGVYTATRSTKQGAKDAASLIALAAIGVNTADLA